MHQGYFKGFATTLTLKGSIGRHYTQKCERGYRYDLFKMSINGVLTIFGHASWII